MRGLSKHRLFLLLAVLALTNLAGQLPGYRTSKWLLPGCDCSLEILDYVTTVTWSRPSVEVRPGEKVSVTAYCKDSSESEVPAEASWIMRRAPSVRLIKPVSVPGGPASEIEVSLETVPGLKVENSLGPLRFDKVTYLGVTAEPTDSLLFSSEGELRIAVPMPYIELDRFARDKADVKLIDPVGDASAVWHLTKQLLPANRADYCDVFASDIKKSMHNGNNTFESRLNLLDLTENIPPEMIHVDLATGKCFFNVLVKVTFARGNASIGTVVILTKRVTCPAGA